MVTAAFAIAIAFGWTLERAGLGSSRKLVGQFYLTDLTVFKVMFSAIVTAMLGLFWLDRLDLLDLSRLPIPETFLAPQAIGGLIFGAGFALAGLCPGTSCVAAATGRGDGLAVVTGLFAGVLATGLAFTPVAPLYAATPRGALTIHDLLGLSRSTVIFAIVGIALAAFGSIGRIERGARVAPHRWLAAGALAAAMLAAAIGAPARPQPPAPAERPFRGC